MASREELEKGIVGLERERLEMMFLDLWEESKVLLREANELKGFTEAYVESSQREISMLKQLVSILAEDKV